MAKTYEIELPSIVETQLTGRALLVRDTIRGTVWEMDCDSGGRPLAIRRSGKNYPTMPTILSPMYRFARNFLGNTES